MECPICYENKTNIVMFPCSHYMCTDCLNSLIDSKCPCCRGSIENLYPINASNFIDQYPKNLPIRINSEKGKSEPISIEEEQVLKLIFGDFVKMEEENYSNLMNRIILIQSYKNNSWFIGCSSSSTNTEITLRDCKYISRSNGKVYSTTPTVRNIKIDSNDRIFYI